MDSIKEEIAKNLLFYRKKNGYTQKQLAEYLGVKNTSISNWESGNNSMDVETLFKICDLFNVSVNDMYGKFANTQDNDFNLHEVALIKAYRANPSMQGAVDKLLGIEETGSNTEELEALFSSMEEKKSVPV